MPVSPADPEELAAEQFGLFDAAQLAIFTAAVKRLARGIDADAWAGGSPLQVAAFRAQVQRIVEDIVRRGVSNLNRLVAVAYLTGDRAAAADLGAPRATPARDDTARVNRQAVAELRAVADTINESAAGMYRGVVSDIASRALAGDLTRRQASLLAVRTWADNGVPAFVDKAGRRWEMGAYAEMSMRTALADAVLRGYTGQAREQGHDLFQVNDVPGECVRCRPFEGKVLSISRYTAGRQRIDGVPVTVFATLASARAEGLFHPNCRHRMVVFRPGVSKPYSDTEDPKGDEQRQQQRAFERRVRQLNRREIGAIQLAGPRSPEAVKATAQLREKRAEFAAWRKANGAKNLAYRENLDAR